jgi:hypothetical protein
MSEGTLSHDPSSNPQAPSNARDALDWPSLLLIISSMLAIGIALIQIVGTFVSTGSPDAWLKFIDDENLRNALRESVERSNESSKGMNVGTGLFMVIGNAVIIFGAMQMRNVRNYAFAVTSAALAITPCCITNCCCFLSMPVGIWALVLLLKPEIKAQFSDGAFVSR